MDSIYFDNAAATKPSSLVLEVFLKASQEVYANPSALHVAGLDAEKLINAVQADVARLLTAKPGEIYFTSGGTESNNLAILGSVNARKRTHKHIITQITEHPAVIEPYKKLEEEGYSVTWLKPDINGYITPGQIKESLCEDTSLVSIMHVNNETGTILDIEGIGKVIKANSSANFFVDGVQGFGKIPVRLDTVDMYSFSGHKLHCVKGVGGLYRKQGVRVIPQISGGGQQKNMRSGTENTSGIAALGEAAKQAYAQMNMNSESAGKLKKRLLAGLGHIEGVSVNGDTANGSPYIVNLSFQGVRGEVLMHALAADGIYVSTGSACANNKNTGGKNVVANMGHPREIYESALRFSFSHHNTLDEVDKCLDMLEKHIVKLRKYMRK